MNSDNVLALIADLYGQIVALQQQNAALVAQLTADVETAASTAR